MSYNRYDKYLDASALKGKTITSISNLDDESIRFSTSDGKDYVMFHSQNCCESVMVHDIVGDLNSLVGNPLVVAREETSSVWPADVETREYVDSYTWTSYFFETATSKVRIRWLGESNGWYSESVQIEETRQ